MLIHVSMAYHFIEPKLLQLFVRSMFLTVHEGIVNDQYWQIYIFFGVVTK